MAPVKRGRSLTVADMTDYQDGAEVWVALWTGQAGPLDYNGPARARRDPAGHYRLELDGTGETVELYPPEAPAARCREFFPLGGSIALFAVAGEG